MMEAPKTAPAIVLMFDKTGTRLESIFFHADSDQVGHNLENSLSRLTKTPALSCQGFTRGNDEQFFH